MPKNIWEEIWDSDPNGLMVVDKDMKIQVVNNSFLKIFNLEGTDILGKSATIFFDNLDDLYEVKNDYLKVVRRMYDYPELDIRTSEVCYSVDDGTLIAKIFNDISHHQKKEKELNALKYKVIDEVNKIAEKQMKIVQEIASILGETTAETKASLFKLVNTFKEEEQG
jgi:PAS domain S-box-containing protein